MCYRSCCADEESWTKYGLIKVCCAIVVRRSNFVVVGAHATYLVSITKNITCLQVRDVVEEESHIACRKFLNMFYKQYANLTCRIDFIKKFKHINFYMVTESVKKWM